MRVRIPGAPVPDASKPYPEPAVPRGWKIGTIIPYYSPAMTGGGVSENFFQDMMAEMQGQVPGGQMPPGLMEAASAANAPDPSKPKKQKRKVIRG
jgi:signal recognition particle subunit SRP19